MVSLREAAVEQVEGLIGQVDQGLVEEGNRDRCFALLRAAAGGPGWWTGGQSGPGTSGGSGSGTTRPSGRPPSVGTKPASLTLRAHWPVEPTAAGWQRLNWSRRGRSRSPYNDRAACGGPLTARELGSRKVWFGLPHYVDVAIWRRASVAVGTLVLLARHSAWSERLRPCHW